MKITVIDKNLGTTRFSDISLREFSDWVFNVWNVAKSALLEDKIKAAKTGGWKVVFD